MTSLRLVLLSATFLPSLWAEPSPGSSIQMDKRFSINMMDPLTRRSALDKNFVRFGRSGGGLNVNREGRGRPDSFVRFGRGDEDDEDQDEILSDRDARGRTDFIRFGRGKADTNSGFIRFGRGKNDNFVRFGRVRQDNFIRFGKSVDDYLEPLMEDNEFHRLTRGVGKSNTNFVRFGKRDPENDEEVINAYKNGLSLIVDPLRNEHLARISRLSAKNKADGFIRFGRTSLFDDEHPKQMASFKELNLFANKLQNIPQRNDDEQIYSDLNSNMEADSELDATKRSPSRNHASSENYTPYETSIHDINRKKRSTHGNHSNEPLPTDLPDLTYLYNSYPSQLAAGFPNFIIGPELSVLPAHAKSRNSLKKIDDKNFIRLG